MVIYDNTDFYDCICKMFSRANCMCCYGYSGKDGISSVSVRENCLKAVRDEDILQLQYTCMRLIQTKKKSDSKRDIRLFRTFFYNMPLQCVYLIL